MANQSSPKIDIQKVLSQDDAGWGDGARNLICPVCGGTYRLPDN